MMPIIKSCLTDDWGPDLRFITCSLTENVLLYLNEMLDCIFYFNYRGAIKRVLCSNSRKVR